MNFKQFITLSWVGATATTRRFILKWSLLVMFFSQFTLFGVAKFFDKFFSVPIFGLPIDLRAILGLIALLGFIWLYNLEL